MSGSVTFFELHEPEDAAELVRRVLPPTPQYAWPKLSSRAGGTVWVKHENHTPTGVFKVRGGIVYMDRLIRSEPGVAGVTTATRGNHGQSVSFAAARAGVPATIYVPHGNSPDQNSSMRAFVGMGSGICGLIAVRDLLGLKTEIVGVSAAKAPASALSFKAGRPVPTPSALTFADRLATREPHPDAIATMRQGAGISPEPLISAA